ncbi:MAG: putative ATPase [Candidatus Azotimanducaceae bacterium]|jgi:predicted ATPase
MSASVFVMSDVVGSTALWETHGDAMRSALEIHDRLLHGAIESAGGRVFKHTGDGMIAVFDDADNAVSGAVNAVGALAAGAWGTTGALEVRVSVHAGSASERDGDFFGPPLNKVARINGVGHANQVLVSDVAHQLMLEPSGTDLGVHQLRDLSEPVRLWQLDDGVYPSLRTLKAARHNLPVMPTEFIGRQAEVDELRALIGHHRLVTISGVGGCGKTRLAVEVAAASADKFPGGVWFVDLTTERDGDKVGDRAIGALGLFQQLGSEGGGPIDALNEATAGAATLLVVDNCEHLIDDVADFATEVLSSATAVTVLATSREALNVDGERAWRIPNMHDAAVELFLDRATAAGVTGLDKHHAQIEDICAQLDDIPLAIELAAARLTSLSIDELTERLDDRFSLLGGGRSRRRQRQQTLQAMMDWSYGLLDGDEQQVLNQLAVFAGSFSLAGVKAVIASSAPTVLDVVDSLVEQSLVVASVDSGRYRLLETVRLYALDRLLNTDQIAATRDRHLSWIDALSGRERLHSTGTGDSWELEEQKLAEVHNVLAAMEWAEQSGQHDVLLSLYLGGATYWGSTGNVAAAISWLDRVPEPPMGEFELRTDWLSTSGQIRYNAGDHARGFEQMLEAATMIDDHSESPLKMSPNPLFYRGALYSAAGDYEAAGKECDRLRSFKTVEGFPRYHEWFAVQLRSIMLFSQRDPGALASITEALEIASTISRMLYDTSTHSMALELSISGRFREALSAAKRCLDSPVLGQSVRVSALTMAANSHAGLGEYRTALDLVERDFGPMLRSQKRSSAVYQLTALALILHQMDQVDRFEQVARLALAQQELTDLFTVSLHLNPLLDVEARPASHPDPADLTPEAIEALINDVITEIGELIAPTVRPGRQ